jgi:hypothetical protein
VSDSIEILKQRISDHIKASDERCVACHELRRQATDLVAMSRDAIARSREKVARLEFKTSVSVSIAGRVEAPSGLTRSAPPSGNGKSRQRLYSEQPPNRSGKPP